MNKERLGAFIGQRRRELGLTQRELAEKVHVTDKAVSKWERGLSYPDVTLLEPLAAALELTVGELMACRRQAAAEGEEDPVKNLLTISGDSLRRARRRIWGRLGAVLALILAAGLVIAWNTLYVTETPTNQGIILKEAAADGNFLYVDLRHTTHLLKFRCGEDVDFDAIQLKNEDGYPQTFSMVYRWNRLTYQGTVTVCEAAGGVWGSEFSDVGGTIGLSRRPGTDDALFGFSHVFCDLIDYYPDPARKDDYLSSWTFWRGDGRTWNVEQLLTVKDCRAYANEDWDGDGVTELLIRTRWEEKPYTVYDCVDGEIVEIWPDSMDPELAEALWTPTEAQEALEAGFGKRP